MEGRKNMNRKGSPRVPCYLALAVITLIAGLVLGATYMLTKDPIAAQESRKAEMARAAVMPDADAFRLLDAAGDDAVDWVYEALRDGARVGYVAQGTGRGFGGEIEVIVGLRADGEITGISVGGASFSETAGLGAKAKEAAFTGGFFGKRAPLTVVKAGETKSESTVDAITSATITSKAVNDTVTRVSEAVRALVEPSENAEGDAQ